MAPTSIGTRYIDSTSISAIRTLIRSELSRATLAQTIKVEPSVRKARGAPVDMLGLGSRMRLAGVGLVDTAPKLQSSSVIPRVGKLGTSRIVFECHDMEDVSLDKQNCTCFCFVPILVLSDRNQISICTRRSQSEVGVSTICGETGIYPI